MYRIGIDLGGTNIAAGLVNEKFEIVTKDSTPTLADRPSEEIVNDTYLKTWNTVPPNRPDPLKGYVGMITRNLSLKRFEHLHRAKRGGAEMVMALDEIAEIADPDAHPQKQIDEQEFARILNAFLRGLPERDCGIFIRRYYYVQSVDEIAHYYRLGRANIFKILSRTRIKLREQLDCFIEFLIMNAF